MRAATILTAAFITLSSLNVEAETFPVPAHTEFVSSETRKIAGSEMEFTYYASAQSLDELKDFYRAKLLNTGWQEKELLKDLQKIPNFQIEPSLTNAFAQNLIFEKEGQTLMVTFLPEGVYADNKTRFTVVQGKIDFQAPVSQEEIFAPELLAKPKKNVAPAYPGASLIAFTEESGSLKATYFSQDTIERVEMFYKDRMPDYGWALTEENPLHKIESGNYGQQEISGVDIKPIEMLYAELSFSNAQGDTCRIGLSQAIANAQLKEIPNITNIMVDYARKKK